MSGSREHRVCPWWLAYTCDTPLRRMLHDPEQILAGLVLPGQTVIDIGCGMGYFTLPLARLVGPGGRVIAVDLQEQMLRRVKKRAERAGLLSRIRLYQCGPDSLGLTDPADFILAFWMVHETADRPRFLVAEPRVHVSASNIQTTVDRARTAGLEVGGEPRIGWSRAVLFRAD